MAGLKKALVNPLKPLRVDSALRNNTVLFMALLTKHFEGCMDCI